MFKKILIANRGEIACRIIRTAHRLGIQCVAIYSTIEANALHVRLADEAYCIGEAPSQNSYLCADKILAIAQKSQAQAIHPGYGFLSENAEFAEQCAKTNICFIGPSPSAIRAMGSKSAAKKIMAAAEVPLVPGYHEAAQDIVTLQNAANTIGYPILLKPIAGGGGKGMRIINDPDPAIFASALAATQREAQASFGNSTVLLEKYLSNPRHIEIQIFADQQGNVVALFERDCSTQRRYQKIIEEAPASHMTEKLRQAMSTAAITAARAIGYVGAGTVEFLLDTDENFYFMEMNTRLQVEHPVTEMITGQDLVEWQFKIASGDPLPLKQESLAINGHAFEARIYAEDPTHNFLPSTGQIHYLKTPALDIHTRIDTGIQQGDTISPYYDPMIAKLIVWDKDRATALQRLHQALANYQIIGVNTNLDLLTQISHHPNFVSGHFDTSFIANHEIALLQIDAPTPEIFVLASLYILLTQINQSQHSHDPWSNLYNWRLNMPAEQTLIFQNHQENFSIYAIQQAENYVLKLSENKIFTASGQLTENKLTATINEQTLTANIFAEKNHLHILLAGNRYQLTYITCDTLDYTQHITDKSKLSLTTPMPGKVIALLGKPGERVAAGTALAIIEAMKMEHTMHAPTAGIIKEWFYQIGDLVDEGVELLKFEEK